MTLHDSFEDILKFTSQYVLRECCYIYLTRAHKIACDCERPLKGADAAASPDEVDESSKLPHTNNIHALILQKATKANSPFVNDYILLTAAAIDQFIIPPSKEGLMTHMKLLEKLHHLIRDWVWLDKYTPAARGLDMRVDEPRSPRFVTLCDIESMDCVSFMKTHVGLSEIEYAPLLEQLRPTSPVDLLDISLGRMSYYLSDTAFRKLATVLDDWKRLRNDASSCKLQ